MNFTYPFLLIMSYLGIFFAPSDVDRITLTGPGIEGSMELVRSVDGWSFQLNSITTVDGKVITTGPSGREETNVTYYIKGLKDHDWSKEAFAALDPATKLEKTRDGFILRHMDDDSKEQVYQIRYHKSGQIISSKEEITINVLGEVNRPGRYTMPKGSSLPEIIGEAGGWTENANPRRIEILHAPANHMASGTTYDLKAILQAAEPSPVLNAAATVFVPQKLF